MFDLEAINSCMEMLHIRCSESYAQDIDSQTGCVTCSGSCQGGCEETCYRSCEGDCSGTCVENCANDCQYSCESGSDEECSICD